MAPSPTTEASRRRPAALGLALPLAAALLTLLAIGAAGCRPRAAERPVRVRPEPGGLVPHEGAGPLWEWDETAGSRLRYRALHPFIEGESAPGRRVFVLRPLFSHEDEGPGSTRWKFRALWPLLLVERDDDAHRVRVFPFVWERDRSKANGTVHDRDFWLLPFVWWGRDTEEGRYFALWPAGGMIRGILGKQYVRFVLWPLWVEAQDKNYHSWNCPWPIFGVWRGPDQRGWRLWPLYGVNQRDGRFKRVFFLWPLGHWWNTGLDTDAPGRVRAFLPFFAKIENEHLHYVSVIWPFFARKHSIQHEFVEWHAPWPFFSRTVGKGLRGVKFWPLYEHRFAPDITRRAFGWKVFVHQVKYTPGARQTKVSACLIFQLLRDEWVETEADGRTVRSGLPRAERNERLAAERKGMDEGAIGRGNRPTEGVSKSRTFCQLWPLFRYRRSATGEKYFTMLEPWPWRQTEIWDRHYGPFYTLYRYERFADGSKRERALFNIYEHSRSATERRVRLSPLTDYWRRGNPAEFKRFRVLGGLFGYERRGTDKRVRLLWIPLGRRPEGWDRCGPTVDSPGPAAQDAQDAQDGRATEQSNGQ
jgi:hypothetical protein